jgi:hypothetical protein
MSACARTRVISHLAPILLAVCGTTVAGPMPVQCTTPPEQASVRLFEYIEDPKVDISSRSSQEAVFSRRLLTTSSPAAIEGALRNARTTYQGNQSDTPLSRRLVAPPVLVPKEDSSWNTRADATVRVLSLSARGKIEQRMAVSCQSGEWKVESFSYGPQSQTSAPIK